MTRRLETSGRFPVGSDRMLEILTSPELLERQHRLQGAARVRVGEARQQGDRLVVEVELEEAHRTMNGVDPDRLDPARTVYTWTLPDKTCSWRYRGTWGEKVRVDGEIRLQEDPDGCRVTTQITVAVSVPLIGRIIEKRITREIEAGFSPFQDLLQEFCQ